MGRSGPFALREDVIRFPDGAEVGVVRYGEQVYVNGRVMSFNAPKPV